MMKSIPVRALVLLVVLLAAAPLWAAQKTAVQGKVTVHQQGTGGVQVLAYPADVLSLKGPAPFLSGETEADGRFELSIPPGQYYFLAGGDGWFNYYGRNPVTVPPAGLTDLNLQLVSEKQSPPEERLDMPVGVVGRITLEGKPVAGATVFVYTDLTTQLKGPGLGMSAPSDEEGMFAVPVPAGTYYLVARLRGDKSFLGPLRAGDYFGYFPGNPLVLNDGEVARLTLPLVEVPAKVDQLAGSLFGQTSIQGRMVDPEGKPVAGVRALLYTDPTMLNRPEQVSQPSDAEGRFVLSFPEGGTYYLSARDSLGGAPSPGSFFGRYSGSPDASVRLKTGEALQGIEISVQPMW